MKCDELVTHWAGTTSSIEGFVYYKDEVDAAIAELKCELRDIVTSSRTAKAGTRISIA